LYLWHNSANDPYRYPPSVLFAASQLEFKSQKKILQFFSVFALLVGYNAYRQDAEVLTKKGQESHAGLIISAALYLIAIVPCYVATGLKSEQKTN